MKDKLLEKALEAKKKSYSPYSNFKVGAAVLTEKGIYTGTNIENSSYSATICAERLAISKAISDGAKELSSILIVGDQDLTYPCGICRQVMAEFNPEMGIILANDKEIKKEMSLKELLPYSFTL